MTLEIDTDFDRTEFYEECRTHDECPYGGICGGVQVCLDGLEADTMFLTLLKEGAFSYGPRNKDNTALPDGSTTVMEPDREKRYRLYYQIQEALNRIPGLRCGYIHLCDNEEISPDEIDSPNSPPCIIVKAKVFLVDDEEELPF